MPIRWPFYFLDTLFFGAGLVLAARVFYRTRNRLAAWLLPWLGYSFVLAATLSASTLAHWVVTRPWTDPPVIPLMAQFSAAVILFSAMLSTALFLDASRG